MTSITCVRTAAVLSLLSLLGFAAQPECVPAYRRTLSAADARQAAALLKQADAAQQQHKYGESLAAWEAIAALRAKAQGEDHWETVQARQLAATLARVAAWPEAKQLALESATRVFMQGFLLLEKGEHAKAQPLLELALAERRRLLGDDHAMTAEGCNTLAQCLEDQGRAADARRLYEQGLAGYGKFYGEWHPLTGNTHGCVGHIWVDLGDFQKAKPHLEKALEVFRDAYGEEHPSTLTALSYLGTCLLNAGHATEAEPLLARSLDLRRKVFGEGHAATAEAYLLRKSLGNQAKYREAQPLLEKGLAVCQRLHGERHPDTAEAHQQLAMNLGDQRRYAAAEPHFRQAWETLGRLHGEDGPEAGEAMTLLAVALNGQAKGAEAEPLCRRALALRCKRFPNESHVLVAHAYSHLASSLYYQGRTAEAIPLQFKALELFRRTVGEENERTAKAYTNLATLLELQQRFIEAQPLLGKALDIFRRVHPGGHPDLAFATLNVGFNLAKQGKYEEAEPLLRKGVELQEQFLPADHLDVADTNLRLAHVLNTLGLGARAEERCRRALATYRKQLPEAHAVVASCYAVLGDILVQQGKFAEARPCLEKALEIRRGLFTEESANTNLSTVQLAVNTKYEGDYARAEALLAQAARHFDRLQPHLAMGGLDRAGVRASFAPYAHLAAVLLRNGKPEEAWLHLEAGLGRSLLDETARRAGSPLTPEERTLRQKFLTDLRRTDAALRRLDQERDKPADYEAIRGRFERERTTAMQRWSEFEQELQRRYPVEGGAVYSLEAVQAQLPADAALITWLDVPGHEKAADPGGDHWACVVRRRGPPRWVRLSGSGPNGSWADEDDLLPGELVKALTSPNAPVEWADLVDRLNRQRLTPLAPLLAAAGTEPAVRRLFVLPALGLADTRFTAVPLAAVPLAALNTDYTISYAPSATLFAWLREKPRRTVVTNDLSLLAVGDAAFVQRRAPTPEDLALRGQVWKLLPGTRREVAALARLFPKADALLGSDASARRLKELADAGQLARYRYLHLATHGQADADLPWQSALILAQDRLPDPLAQALAGREADDGRLTAETILQDWSLDADLVTLSACETGLGRLSGGEGYLGFAQPLLLAGARSLVVSKWQVDDTATALLMVRFYENLLGRRLGTKPLPKAEALREAQAWLRALTAAEAATQVAALPAGGDKALPARLPPGERPFAHPYYWSAFILIGDPD